MSKPLETTNQDQIAKSLFPRQTKNKITIVFVIVVGFYLLSTILTNSTITRFIVSMDEMWGMILQLFPPNWAYAGSVWPDLIETIHMAVIATTFAGLISIPLSLLAANTVVSNKYLYNVVRLFMNIMRTIPDLLLAVIFVGLFGIGVFSGIMALIIFSLGILSKLMSETIEAIDLNPLEAIRASGGNIFQVIWYAVVPQVLPQFVSFTLYVFELNIRASVVLGFVGAGGIGLLLQQTIAFLDYRSAMTIIIIIFAVVVVIEYFSTKIREAIV
jgi:phosphonate transport system permease protein